MSWKKYGAKNKYEKTESIRVKNLVAENFTLQDLFKGDITLDSGSFKTSLDIESGRNSRLNNVRISGTLRFQDIDSGVFITGNTEYIGINTDNPQAILDISGSKTNILRVLSSLDTTTNVLSQNVTNQGIAMTIDSSASTIHFYHKDHLLNATMDAPSGAQIQYNQFGTLELDTSSQIFLRSNLHILSSNETADIAHTDSTVLIQDKYEVSQDTSNIYLPHIYQNPSSTQSATTGNALHLMSRDTSSNVFMSATNTENVGWHFGGGIDLSSGKAMGTMGWVDMCSNNYYPHRKRYIPSQTAFAGNEKTITRSTTGFNMYRPTVDDYAVDINGPLKIDHNEIHVVANLPFEVNSIGFARQPSSQFGVALSKITDIEFTKSIETIEGTLVDTIDSTDLLYNVALTYDNGKTWKVEDYQIRLVEQSKTIHSLGDPNTILTSVDVIDDNNAFITIENDIYKYNDISFVNTGSTGDIDILQSFAVDSSLVLLLNTTSKNNDNVVTSPNNDVYLVNYKKTKASIQVSTIDENNNIIILDNGKLYIINATNNTDFSGNTDVSLNYNSVKVKGDTLVAVGFLQDTSFSNILYSYNYKNIDSDTASFSLASTNTVTPEILNDLVIIDSSNVLLVGNNGNIYYTNDGFETIKSADTEMIGTMGNASLLLDGSVNIMKTEMMENENTFYFLTNRTDNGHDISATPANTPLGDRDATVENLGSSTIMYGYFPQMFHPKQAPYILDVNGNVTIEGRVLIEKDVDIGGYTEISGYTYIYDRLDVIEDVSFHSKLDVSDNTLLRSRLDVLGDASFNKNVTVSGDTFIHGSLFVYGETTTSSTTNMVIEDSLIELSKDHDSAIAGEPPNDAGFIINRGADFSNVFMGWDESANKFVLGSTDTSGTAVGNFVTNDVSISILKANVESNYIYINKTIKDDGVEFHGRNLNDYQFDVDGKGRFDGRFDVIGDVSFQSELDVSEAVLFRDVLTVRNDVSFMNELDVSNSVRFAHYLTVQNDVSFMNELDVSNAVRFNDYLTVQNDVSFMNELDVSNSVRFAHYLTVQNDVSFMNELDVSNAVRFNDTLTVQNDVSFMNELDVSNSVRFAHYLTVQNDVSFMNELDVSNAVRFAHYLTVQNDVSFMSKLDVTDLTTLHGKLNVFETTGTAGNAVGGSITLIHDDTSGASSIVFKSKDETDYGLIRFIDDVSMTNSNVNYPFLNTDSVQNSCLFVHTGNNAGDTTHEDHIVIRPTGNLVLDTGISAESWSSGGDIIVLPSGGKMVVGLSGQDSNNNYKVDVSGNVRFQNRFDVVGDVSFYSELDVSEAVLFRDTLTVKNDVSFMNELDVSNAVRFNDKLTVQNDVSFMNELDVSNAVRFNHTLTVQNNVSFMNELDVSNAVRFADTLTVQSDVSFMNDLDVSRNLRVHNDLIVTNNIRGYADLDIYKATTLSGDVRMKSRLDVIGDVSFQSALNVLGELDVSENALFRNRVDVVADVSFQSNVDISESLLIKNRLDVQGDVSFQNNVSIDNDAELNVGSRTIITDGAVMTDVFKFGGQQFASYNSDNGLIEIALNGQGIKIPGQLVVGQIEALALNVGATRQEGNSTDKYYINEDICGSTVSISNILESYLYNHGFYIRGNRPYFETSVSFDDDMLQSAASTITNRSDTSSFFRISDYPNPTGDQTRYENELLNGTYDPALYPYAEDAWSIKAAGSSNILRLNLGERGLQFPNYQKSNREAMVVLRDLSGESDRGNDNYEMVASNLVWMDKGQSNLDISGSMNIRDMLTVSGETGIYDTFTVYSTNGVIEQFSVAEDTGATTINGTLDVSGNTTIKANLTVQTDSSNDVFHIDQSTGNTTISGSVDISGETTIDNTFTVRNIAGDTDWLNVNQSTGATNIYGILNVSGNTTIKANLTVQTESSNDVFHIDQSTGNTTISGTVGISDETTIDADFHIRNSINTDTFTVTAATGELYAENKVRTNNFQLFSPTDNTNDISLVDYELSPSHNSIDLSAHYFQKFVEKFGNDFDSTKTNYTYSVMSNGSNKRNGLITMTGGTTSEEHASIQAYNINRDQNSPRELYLNPLGGNIGIGTIDPQATLDICGTLKVQSTTESTDSSSGAMTVSGGVGIGGRLNVNGDTVIHSTTQSDATNNGALQVKGGLGVGLDTYIGGQLVVKGNLTIEGTTTTVDTSNIVIEDRIITIARNVTDSTTHGDAGILINRGSDVSNAFIGFDETKDKFFIGFTDNSGVNDISVVNVNDFTLGTVQVNVDASKIDVYDVSVNNDFFVQRNVDIDGQMDVLGAVNISGATTIDNNLIIRNNGGTINTFTVSGDSGDTRIYGTLDVSGETTVKADFHVQDESGNDILYVNNVSGEVDVYGKTQIYNDFVVNRNPTWQDYRFQKVRLSQTVNKGFTIMEFQVWINGSNVAASGNGGIASASSTHSNQLPTYTNNETLNNFWQPSSTSTGTYIGEYLDISLAQEYSINNIQSVVIIPYNYSNAHIERLKHVNFEIFDSTDTIIYRRTIDTTNKYVVRFDGPSIGNVSDFATTYDGMTEKIAQETSVSGGITYSVGKFDIEETDFFHENGLRIVLPTFTISGDTGNTVIKGELDVINPVRFANTLTVTNDVSFMGALDVSNAVRFADTLTVTNNVSFMYTLDVSNAVRFADTLTVTSDVSFMGTLDVSGAVTFQDELTVHQLATFENGISTTGAVTFNDDVIIKNKLRSDKFQLYNPDSGLDVSMVDFDICGSTAIDFSAGYVQHFVDRYGTTDYSLNDISGYTYTVLHSDFSGTDISRGSLINMVGPAGANIQSWNITVDASGERPLSLNPLGGNVGVGTIDPTETVDICGTLQVQDKSYFRDVTFFDKDVIAKSNVNIEDKLIVQDTAYSKQSVVHEDLFVERDLQVDGQFHLGNTLVQQEFGDSWIQRGSDISGSQNDDKLGKQVYLSTDGKTLAVGLQENVRVYDYDLITNNEYMWLQRGEDISGSSNSDTNTNLSMSSDGNVIATRISTDSNTTVRIFAWDLSTNNQYIWLQRGEDISDDSRNTGKSISLNSDGTVVAVGLDNDTVKVYHWDLSTNTQYMWLQQGSTLGTSGTSTNFGESLQLSSDGTVLAVGEYGYDVVTDNNEGRVIVYDWSTDYEWVTSLDISGSNSDDQFGWSLSLSSNGKVLAVGANQTAGSGYVRVYKRNHDNWHQIGTDISGGETSNDQFGHSVSLNNDGTILVVSEKLHDASTSAASNNYGLVRVFKWDLSESNWVQFGQDISGSNISDEYGHAVAINGDGTVIAASSIKYNNGDSSILSKGLVQVWTIDQHIFMDNNLKLTGRLLVEGADARISERMVVGGGVRFANTGQQFDETFEQEEIVFDRKIIANADVSFNSETTVKSNFHVQYENGDDLLYVNNVSGEMDMYGKTEMFNDLVVRPRRWLDYGFKKVRLHVPSNDSKVQIKEFQVWIDGTNVALSGTAGGTNVTSHANCNDGDLYNSAESSDPAKDFVLDISLVEAYTVSQIESIVIIPHPTEIENINDSKLELIGADGNTIVYSAPNENGDTIKRIDGPSIVNVTNFGVTFNDDTDTGITNKIIAASGGSDNAEHVSVTSISDQYFFHQDIIHREPTFTISGDTGDTIIKGELDVSNAVRFAHTLTVHNDVSFMGTLDVSNAVRFADTLTVHNDVSFMNKLDVSGDTTVKADFHVQDETGNDILYVNNVSGEVDVYGKTKIYNDFVVSSKWQDYRFRKVRLYQTDDSLNFIIEFQVWIDGTNVASSDNGGTAYATSEKSDRLAAHAIDASLNTWWRPENKIAPKTYVGQHLDISLNQEYSISEIESVVIISHNAYILALKTLNFEIFDSTDTIIYSKTIDTTDKHIVRFDGPSIGNVTDFATAYNSGTDDVIQKIAPDGTISSSKNVGKFDIEEKDFIPAFTVSGDTGHTTIRGELDVINPVRFANTLTVTNDVSFMGTLDVSGIVRLHDDVIIDNKLRSNKFQLCNPDSGIDVSMVDFDICGGGGVIDFSAGYVQHFVDRYGTTDYSLNDISGYTYTVLHSDFSGSDISRGSLINMVGPAGANIQSWNITVDASGERPLSLNPLGGNVGVGTIDPSFATLDVSGTLYIRSTEASTSHDSGAVIVQGGVGISGDVHIGSKLEVQQDVSFVSALDVYGKTQIYNDFVVRPPLWNNNYEFQTVRLVVPSITEHVYIVEFQVWIDGSNVAYKDHTDGGTSSGGTATAVNADNVNYYERCNDGNMNTYLNSQAGGNVDFEVDISLAKPYNVSSIQSIVILPHPSHFQKLDNSRLEIIGTDGITILYSTQIESGDTYKRIDGPSIVNVTDFATDTDWGDELTTKIANGGGEGHVSKISHTNIYEPKFTVSYSGNTAIEGTLDVSRSVQFDHTLTVQNHSEFQSSVSIGTSLDVGGETTVKADFHVQDETGNDILYVDNVSEEVDLYRKTQIYNDFVIKNSNNIDIDQSFNKIRLFQPSGSSFDITELQLWIDSSNVALATAHGDASSNSINSINDARSPDKINNNTISGNDFYRRGDGENIYLDICFNLTEYSTSDIQSIVLYPRANYELTSARNLSLQLYYNDVEIYSEPFAYNNIDVVRFDGPDIGNVSSFTDTYGDTANIIQTGTLSDGKRIAKRNLFTQPTFTVSGDTGDTTIAGTLTVQQDVSFVSALDVYGKTQIYNDLAVRRNPLWHDYKFKKVRLVQSLRNLHVTELQVWINGINVALTTNGGYSDLSNNDNDLYTTASTANTPQTITLGTERNISAIESIVVITHDVSFTSVELETLETTDLELLDENDVVIYRRLIGTTDRFAVRFDGPSMDAGSIDFAESYADASNNIIGEDVTVDTYDFHGDNNRSFVRRVEVIDISQNDFIDYSFTISDVNGHTTIRGELDVSNATRFADTLTVQNHSEFQSSVSIGTSLDVSGETTVKSDFHVQDESGNDILYVNNVSGEVDVYGKTKIYNDFVVSSKWQDYKFKKVKLVQHSSDGNLYVNELQVWIDGSNVALGGTGYIGDDSSNPYINDNDVTYSRQQNPQYIDLSASYNISQIQSIVVIAYKSTWIDWHFQRLQTTDLELLDENGVVIYRRLIGTTNSFAVRFDGPSMDLDSFTFANSYADASYNIIGEDVTIDTYYDNGTIRLPDVQVSLIPIEGNDFIINPTFTISGDTGATTIAGTLDVSDTVFFHNVLSVDNNILAKNNIYTQNNLVVQETAYSKQSVVHEDLYVERNFQVDRNVHIGSTLLKQDFGTDWTQKGENIIGDVSGQLCGRATAMSSNGKILAVGCPAIYNGDVSGHVQVYEWVNDSWSTLGGKLNESLYRTGTSVALSNDGTVLALNFLTDTSDNNFAIYKWDLSTNDTHEWLKIGDTISYGMDISNADQVGLSNSSNGIIFAVSNTQWETYTGRVRVFHYDNYEWKKLGNDIYSRVQETASNFGNSLSLSSDGTTIAIGERNQHNVEVFAYDLSGTEYDWTPLGDAIQSNSLFGHSVSLSSDGRILAASQTPSSNASTKVFKWDTSDNVWIQLGNDISSNADYIELGESVSLSSDGTILAIGASSENRADGYRIIDYLDWSLGFVRIYKWNPDIGDWQQLGTQIESGYAQSVSLSSDGSVVATGFPYYDGDISNSGIVRVYEIGTKLTVDNNFNIDGYLSVNCDLSSGTSMTVSGDVLVYGKIEADVLVGEVLLDKGLQITGALPGIEISGVSILSTQNHSDTSIVTFKHNIYMDDAYNVYKHDGTDVSYIKYSGNGIVTEVSYFDRIHGATGVAADTTVFVDDPFIPITEIYSNAQAFAALRADGSVVTWGGAGSTQEYIKSDGSTQDVSEQLKSGVTRIYGSGNKDTIFEPYGAPVFSNGSDFFAAVKNDGSVVTWGNSFNGGGNSQVVSDLLTSGVSAVYMNGGGLHSGVVALKSSDMVAWGWDQYGGDHLIVRYKGNVKEIYATGGAFAALAYDGDVFAWGSTGTEISGQTDVKRIYATGNAFAALKNGGSVVTGGNANYGGTSEIYQSASDSSPVSVATSLSGDVSTIYATERAFAALKTDGSVVTWGLATYGGDYSNTYDANGIPSSVSGPVENVIAIYSTQRAFTALKQGGSVVTWGRSDYGGDSSSVTSSLTSVSTIYSTQRAFAALKTNGTVVTWGKHVGNFPSSGVNDVRTIYSSLRAFAALKNDGSVVTWGHSDYGGDSSSVTSSLTSVIAIYSTQTAFAALKTDGTVVTWGDSDYGGDSSSVASQLNTVKRFHIHNSGIPFTDGSGSSTIINDLSYAVQTSVDINNGLGLGLGSIEKFEMLDYGVTDASGGNTAYMKNLFVDSTNNLLIHHTYTNSHLKHKLINTNVMDISQSNNGSHLLVRHIAFSRDGSRYASSHHNASDYGEVIVRNTSDHSVVGNPIIQNGDLSNNNNFTTDLSGMFFGVVVALNGDGNRLAILASHHVRGTKSYSRVFIKQFDGSSWQDLNNSTGSEIFYRAPNHGNFNSIDLDSTGDTLVVCAQYAYPGLGGDILNQFVGTTYDGTEVKVGGVLIYKYNDNQGKFILTSGLQGTVSITITQHSKLSNDGTMLAQSITSVTSVTGANRIYEISSDGIIGEQKGSDFPNMGGIYFKDNILAGFSSYGYSVYKYKEETEEWVKRGSDIKSPNNYQTFTYGDVNDGRTYSVTYVKGGGVVEDHHRTLLSFNSDCTTLVLNLGNMYIGEDIVDDTAYTGGALMYKYNPKIDDWIRFSHFDTFQLGESIRYLGTFGGMLNDGSTMTLIGHNVVFRGGPGTVYGPTNENLLYAVTYTFDTATHEYNPIEPCIVDTSNVIYNIHGGNNLFDENSNTFHMSRDGTKVSSFKYNSVNRKLNYTYNRDGIIYSYQIIQYANDTDANPSDFFLNISLDNSGHLYVFRGKTNVFNNASGYLQYMKTQTVSNAVSLTNLDAIETNMLKSNVSTNIGLTGFVVSGDGTRAILPDSASTTDSLVYVLSLDPTGTIDATVTHDISQVDIIRSMDNRLDLNERNDSGNDRFFGAQVDMTEDGNRVAIVSHGRISIFDIGGNNDIIQVGSAISNGTFGLDQLRQRYFAMFGVSMNKDGTIVARLGLNGSGIIIADDQSGVAAVYKLNESNEWVQMGSDISWRGNYSERQSVSGIRKMIQLDDLGTTMVIGYPWGESFDQTNGTVKLWKWCVSDWVCVHTIRASELNTSSDSSYDKLGWGVQLSSDGLTMTAMSQPGSTTIPKLVKYTYKKREFRGIERNKGSLERLGDDKPSLMLQYDDIFYEKTSNDLTLVGDLTFANILDTDISNAFLQHSDISNSPFAVGYNDTAGETFILSQPTTTDNSLDISNVYYFKNGSSNSLLQLSGTDTVQSYHLNGNYLSLDLSPTDISYETYNFNNDSSATIIESLSNKQVVPLSQFDLGLADLSGTTHINYLREHFFMYNDSGTITKSTDDYRLLQKSNLEIKNVHGPLPTNGEGGIVEGTITMKHVLTGGASSIVFQNALRSRAFGTIEYHDSKLTSESMHLNYALGDSLNKEQSVFYIGTKTDESNDDTDDTMVIRSGKNLILDASRYTNTVANAPSTVENRVNEDNTVYIQPNGGFLTVGGNDQTTGDMEVWCDLIVRGTLITKGAVESTNAAVNSITCSEINGIDGVNDGYITVNNRIVYDATDFYMSRRGLGKDYDSVTENNHRDRCRALVSYNAGDGLARLDLNFHNDFGAGVYIWGKTEIQNNLNVGGPITAHGGTFSASIKLDGNAAIYFYDQSATGAYYIRHFGGNMQFTAPLNAIFKFNRELSAPSFGETSDYRLKDQVQTLSGSYYTVDNIRPVHYILKDSQVPHMGFIAHEIQEHFPTMVSGEKDGKKMQTVKYSQLIPVLVKEIQESKAREKEKNQEAIARDQEIAELKSSITSLQQEFTRVHQLVRTMEEKLGRFSPR